MKARDGEAEWKAWRMTGATASRIACSATGQYGGILGAVADLRGLDLPEASDSQQADYDRGHAWEPHIADMVHSATQQKLFVFGEETWCQHRDHPRHLATIDGMLGPGAECTLAQMVAILEMKTIRVGVDWNMAYWLHQVQWQMHVTGFDVACLAIVTINHDGSFGGLAIRWVKRDNQVITQLVALADLIWSHVDNGTLPEPDCASAVEIVKHLTRLSDPEANAEDMSDDASDLARFCDIKAATKAVDDEEKLLASRFRMRLGGATKGTADGFNISYSAPSLVLSAQAEADVLELHPEFAKTTVSLDLDAVKAAKFDLKPFKEHIGSRRLLINRKKSRK